MTWRLKIPELAEIDLDLPRDADVVADAILSVERHPRYRRDDVRARPELRERGFLFRHVPHELETERQRPAGRDGAGRRAVEWIRNVDAGRISAVGACVFDVVPGDGDFVVGRRGEPGDVLERRSQSHRPVVTEDGRTRA